MHNKQIPNLVLAMALPCGKAREPLRRTKRINCSGVRVRFPHLDNWVPDKQIARSISHLVLLNCIISSWWVSYISTPRIEAKVRSQGGDHMNVGIEAINTEDLRYMTLENDFHRLIKKSKHYRTYYGTTVEYYSCSAPLNAQKRKRSSTSSSPSPLGAACNLHPSLSPQWSWSLYTLLYMLRVVA